jgi:hypothetical protein
LYLQTQRDHWQLHLNSNEVNKFTCKCLAKWYIRKQIVTRDPLNLDSFEITTLRSSREPQDLQIYLPDQISHPHKVIVILQFDSLQWT